MHYLLPELNHTDNQQYIIYGTGEAAKQYFLQIKSRYGEKSVSFFLETNPNKNEFVGKDVFSPSKLKTIDINRYKYIVTSFASTQIMIDKLVSLGIDEKMIIRPIKPLYNMTLGRNIDIANDICFYPKVTDKKVLQDLLVRIEWYIPKTKFNNVKLYLATDIDNVEKLENVIYVDTEQIEKKMLNCDIILVWDKKSLDETIIEANKSKVYCVDHMFYSTVECQTYRTIYYNCLDNNAKEYFNNLSKLNFGELVKKNKNKQKAYLFGTGPSLDQAYRFDYTNGFNIVCNSIVKNHRLQNHIKPDLLVFADPVFHFSPCEYARKFREDALESMKKYNDLYCLVPDYNVPILLAHYPNMKDKIIGMPTISKDKFNFPNIEHFYTRGSSNILTLFMIPVASSIAKEIYILGCDGRQKSETYFWKHSKDAQYEGLMKTVFDMHPSFFRDRIYEDYYEEHCENLRGLIEYGEEQEKKYYSLTPSYIPVLKERMISN
ncbi:hypothetical protein [Clostridium sp. BSD9I1]|uniref:hypothetical protein n=1 Tax=Clostridium sp. BSD9I1 TaxID=2003589 RepID=UPI001646B090|nr:hypothetical protein [Clostridium sp. BSD9I1]